MVTLPCVSVETRIEEATAVFQTLDDIRIGFPDQLPFC